MPSTNPKAAVRKIKYRCFEKEFTDFIPCETVTEQKHLDYDDKGVVVIVDDRPCDWQELADKDVDKVGIKYVLEMAKKGLVDSETLRFRDEEALDLSKINPMDPQAIKDVIGSTQENAQKLESIAKELGVSVNDLVQAFASGTLGSLVDSKTATVEKKEGEQNA